MLNFAVEMEQLTQALLESSSLPLFTAVLLGVLVAVNPCILTANTVVLALLCKDSGTRGRLAFRHGLLYALGRTTMYSLLGAACIYVLKRGASLFGLGDVLGEYAEYILVPVLIVVGLILIFGNKLHIHTSDSDAAKRGGRLRGGFKSFALGMVFALVFCPVSAALYFGMLIPMSAFAPYGYAYPVVFGLSSGFIVVMMAWVMAFGISGMARFGNALVTFQKRMNIVVGIILIAAGLLLCLHIMMEH